MCTTLPYNYLGKYYCAVDEAGRPEVRPGEGNRKSLPVDREQQQQRNNRNALRGS